MEEDKTDLHVKLETVVKSSPVGLLPEEKKKLLEKIRSREGSVPIKEE